MSYSHSLRSAAILGAVSASALLVSACGSMMGSSMTPVFSQVSLPPAVQVPAGKAAVASYTGYMAELENTRNALRAWAASHGYEVKDRAYEDYKSGIASAFTENGQFDVYWPVK